MKVLISTTRKDFEKISRDFNLNSHQIKFIPGYADETGEGFIFDMFLYELGNHEYIVTGRFEDTLDAVGLTFEEVKESKTLEHGLIKARNKYIKEYQD